MARRHYNIESDNFPKGLIFYAPMNQGDLTDHISGNDLQGYDSNKVQWDSSVGMYKVIKQAQADEMNWNVNLLYNATTNPNGLQLIADQNYTVYAYCQRLTTTTNNYPPYAILGTYATSDTFNPGLQSMRVEANIGTRELLLGRVYRRINRNTEWITIYNGAVNIYNTEVNAGARHNPANWVQTNYTKVAVNPKRGQYDPANINIYISNIMIFNRALSDDELIFLSTNFTNWL